MSTNDDTIEGDDAVEDLDEVWGYDRRKAVYGAVSENEIELRPLAIANSVAMILTAHTSREHVSEEEWARDAVYSAALVERWTHDLYEIVQTVDELEEQAASARAKGQWQPVGPERGEYDFEWVVGEFKINSSAPFVAVGVLQRDGSVRLIGPDQLNFNDMAGSPQHYRELSAEQDEEEREATAAGRLEALGELGPGVAERLIDILDDEALSKLVEGLRKRRESQDC